MHELHSGNGQNSELPFDMRTIQEKIGRERRKETIGACRNGFKENTSGKKQTEEKEKKKMKINKIASVCTKSKQIYLYDDIRENEVLQWAGDGGAIYALLGLPEFDRENILNAFGIEREKKDDYLIMKEIKPEYLNLNEYAADDIEAMLKAYDGLTLDGVKIVPILAQGKIYFVQEKYLAPIRFDTETKVILRQTTVLGKQRTYFVITDGLFPIAAIMPFKLGLDKIEWMKLLLSSVQ